MIGSEIFIVNNARLGQVIAENLGDFDAGLFRAFAQVGDIGRIYGEGGQRIEIVGPAHVDPHGAVALIDPADFTVWNIHGWIRKVGVFLA